MKLSILGLRYSIASIVIFVGFFVPRFSYGQTCGGIFEIQASSTSPTSVRVAGLEKHDIYFHNNEIKSILKTGISEKNLQHLLEAVQENLTIAIPIDKDGFVAAANVGNHSGNYGNYIWFRDFARTNAGLAALSQLLAKTKSGPDAQREARLAARAMLQLLENPQWTQAAIENIRDPSLHIPGGSGHGVVIWIRRLLAPFKEHRPPTIEELLLEKDWGHKQNDALAALAENVLEAVRDGRLSLKDFSNEGKLNFVLLAAYFVRLQQAEMWDVGSWEEQSALRTSSVAMVTEFMLRFQAGFHPTTTEGLKHKEKLNQNEEQFFTELRNEVLANLTPRLGEETSNIVTAALMPSAISGTITAGVDLVLKHLSGPRPIEAVNDQNISRFEDTALLHMLWSKWNFLPHEKVLELINGLNILKRPSGYARYEEDWFLYGGAEGAKHIAALGLNGKLLMPDGHGGLRPMSPEEASTIAQLHLEKMYNKDMKPVTEVAGKGLEAQWTLPDSYLTQIFSELFIATKNSEYLEKAKYHFARASGLITGKGQVSSEGSVVEAWRMPEAYIPLTVLVEGKPQIQYVVSPNSPLNWATAEYLVAFNKIREALSFQKD